MVDGYVNLNNYSDDIWYVPYKDYKLKKIEAWKKGGKTSGFEVTFSAPSSYVDWPDVTFMFGTRYFQ